MRKAKMMKGLRRPRKTRRPEEAAAEETKAEEEKAEEDGEDEPQT